ncbi:ISKra4 family transposase [Micromonospora sp. CPCC 206061]|uniref:ISKra4 family transposase n=1 Tax=Micromonospora sp. CPCC 206061 TaxID=3122410 RepID=UPI002FF1BE46
MSEAEMMACTQHALEEYVTEAGRELQRQLMQDQLDARAAREPRLGQIAGADGVARRRAEAGHRRLVATTVGPVEVRRIAYRAPGAPNLYPADAQLALPQRLYSFPLRRQVVHEVAAGSLRAAREAIIRATGQHLGTRQLMQIATETAVDIRDFYQPADGPSTDPSADGRDVLVLSIDATGVNMIGADLREPAPTRPAGPQPPSAQLARRERTGRTRMAVVTAVYDAAPAPRTAADILPADPAERATRRRGPRTSGRKVDASLEHSVAPMVTDLFDQAQARDPQHRRRWVVLVDGANHQLDRIRQEAQRRGVHIDIIVDFIHVLEYLWKAAEDLHTSHNAHAAFVHATARGLLEGHAPRVVADLCARLRIRAQTNDPAPGLERATAYLHAKQPYLNYHIALALGWPIATGVIEGCCRYLVKDRLDITGARWSLTGAEAVLLLSAVIANGDFDQYWQFHIDREYQRTHASRYKDQYALAA